MGLPTAVPQPFHPPGSILTILGIWGSTMDIGETVRRDERGRGKQMEKEKEVERRGQNVRRGSALRLYDLSLPPHSRGLRGRF